MTDEIHTPEHTPRLALPTSYAWFNAWYTSSTMATAARVHKIGIPTEFPDATVSFTVRSGSTQELIAHKYHAFTRLDPDAFATTAPLAKAIHELCASAVRDGIPDRTLDIRIAPTSSEDGYAVWYREVRK